MKRMHVSKKKRSGHREEEETGNRYKDKDKVIIHHRRYLIPSLVVSQREFHSSFWAYIIIITIMIAKFVSNVIFVFLQSLTVLLFFQVIFMTLLGLSLAVHDAQQVEQRVEVTKTAQQAVPVVAYGADGFPYATQAIRPVQVKTTTTNRVESSAPTVGHVAAAPLVQTSHVAAPVVSAPAVAVASAPVVASPVYTSAYYASPYYASYVSPYHYWPNAYTGYTTAYTAPVVASTHHVSAGYAVPSVYGYALNGHYISPYENYMLLKKKKK